LKKRRKHEKGILSCLKYIIYCVSDAMSLDIPALNVLKN
jgi:hypothetical protein